MISFKEYINFQEIAGNFGMEPPKEFDPQPKDSISNLEKPPTFQSEKSYLEKMKEKEELEKNRRKTFVKRRFSK